MRLHQTLKTNLLRGACLLFALASGAIHAANPAVIRIGSPQIGVGQKFFPGVNTLAIVNAHGWLEEEFRKDGIEIQWVSFRGAGPAVNEALANKQLDIVSLGDLAAVIGKSSGTATRLILANSRGANSYLATSPGSDIKSVKDLKGRKVAVLLGTAYQRRFELLLRDANLAPRDVKLVSLDWPTSKAAVVSKDIDATFGGNDLLLLRDKGVGIPLSTKGRGGDYTIQSSILASDDFATKHPEIVTRVVKQLVRAAAWAAEDANRDKVLALWANGSSVPLEVLQHEFEGESVKARVSPLLDEAWVDVLKGVAEDGLEQKLIRRAVDVDAWIDDRFLKEALKQARLERHWPKVKSDPKNDAKR
ncbi:MAG: ABC transporter substrate-binding protein [Moraxellaceae bacterium]|nr:ABC transporter substrate-binding protein [Moraxellaceae bacterium]